jgi:invasion protein IalB
MTCRLAMTLIASSLLIAASAVHAQTKPAAAPTKKPAAEKPQDKHEGRFGEWDAVTTTEGKTKVCYMLSRPKKSEGETPKRQKVYVLVMHRAAANSTGVVSINGGFNYKDGSEALVEIGAEKFQFYTSPKTPDTAWALDDGKVLQAMFKAKSMMVRSTPAKGAAVTDSYSLDGAQKAYHEMSKACGVKP